MSRNARAIAAGAGAALVVAVAVAVLLLARGGPPAAIAPPAVAPALVALAQPRGGIALARQDGDRVVALSLRRARSGAQARVTVLGPAGGGVAGLAVTLAGGIHAVPCGRGCYEARLPRAAGSVAVHLHGPGARTSSAVFTLPRAWPVSAVSALRRVERTLRAAHSVVYREHLASAPGVAITSLWRVVAPHSLAYSTATGSDGIVIGARRWDRDAAGKPWLPSPQDPLDLPTPPWGAHVQDVVRLDPPAGQRAATIRLALFDPATPAWYELTVDAASDRLRSVHMTAVSHFMRDDYLGYDSAPPIRPPADVAG